MIKVKFWGTRGSIATPGKNTSRYGGNTSCVELRVDNQVLVFDAGTGFRVLGLQLAKEFSKRPLTVRLFVSHTHWDHIQGFPFFMPAYDSKNRIFIYGPPGRDKSLSYILKMQMDSDYFPVELGDMKAKITVQEIRKALKFGELRVEPFYLNHPAMTFAYRVTYGSKVVIYATDNEPYRYSLHWPASKTKAPSDYPDYLDQRFVEFISDADLLIGESQYTSKEYEEKRGWGHSPVESLVEFAWRARVKQLVMFHLIRIRGGKLKCQGAKEGMELTIGKKRS